MTHFATASAVGTTVAYENRVSPHIADRDREIIRKARQPRVLAWGSLCGRFLAPCDSRLSEPSLVGAHRQGGGHAAGVRQLAAEAVACGPCAWRHRPAPRIVRRSAVPGLRAITGRVRHRESPGSNGGGPGWPLRRAPCFPLERTGLRQWAR